VTAVANPSSKELGIQILRHVSTEMGGGGLHAGGTSVLLSYVIEIILNFYPSLRKSSESNPCSYDVSDWE